MEDQIKLKKYTNSFIDALSPYLKKGFQISAIVHPATGEGAVIEFEINQEKRSEITIIAAVPSVNDTLGTIEQTMIGGDIENVSFRGTNLYMDGQRIIIIKGEDNINLWNKKAANDDVMRIVSPRGSAK